MERVEKTRKKFRVPRAVDPKTGTVDPFRLCWNLLNDYDIFTDQSGSDVDYRTSAREMMEEGFEAYVKGGQAAYDKFRNGLNMRTDLSQDDVWLFDEQEDSMFRLLNLYDNLVAQDVVG